MHVRLLYYWEVLFEQFFQKPQHHIELDPQFLNLATEISIQVTTNLYPLEQVNEALEDMKHSRIDGEAVLVVNS